MSAICSASDADKSDSNPQIRNFVQFSTSGSNHNSHGSLRILQFNVLADGLSALRPDHGNFSRTKYEDLVWETRSQYLLFEILQYKPDVVTLQECDHFDDFFKPELKRHGYKGYFAPKPDSTCLEVSDRCDGCAIFVKSDKLKVTSNKVLTYVVSKAQVRLQPGDDYTAAISATAADETPLAAEDHVLKPQNQLALILTCELRNHSDSDVRLPPVPVFIATTHLKAMKSAVGERYRAVEMQQLIRKVHEIRNNLTRLYNVKPAVIITGDLNACPPSQSQGSGYKSLTYETIKSEENQSLLRLKSVYNDDYARLLLSSGGSDVDTMDINKTDSSLWTTWKSRVKNGSESVVKQCIDYILYNTTDNAANIGVTNNNSVIANNTATCADYADDCDGTVIGGTDVNIIANCVRELYVVPIAVLEIYPDAYVSEHFMPSAIYPSDHLAICADVDIVE